MFSKIAAFLDKLERGAVRPLYVAIGVGVGIVVLWILWALLAPALVTKNHTNEGTFGDMFGGLNTLFTGLAFAGLIYTILQQREQLALARSEIEDNQRTEIQQRFEGTFFQLLNLLTGIVNSTDYHEMRPNSVVIVKQGRDAFFNYAHRLLLTLNEGRTSDEPAERIPFIVHRYRPWYDKHLGEVAHYFRVLYRILQHIDTAEHIDKRAYAKILRAQLSNQELLLLFYNSFIPEGEKMRKHIHRYALLKHVSIKNLPDQNDKDLYEPAAFSDEFAELWHAPSTQR